MAQHQLLMQIPELRSDIAVPHFCALDAGLRVEGLGLRVEGIGLRLRGGSEGLS